MENKEIQLQKALETNESLKNVLSDAKKKTNPTTLKKGMKQKSIIGAILLLILVLTGTFAWQSYQQRAINPFYDPSGNHGVRFHDRLELEDASLPYTDARFGYANMINPDLTIFAENFGDMDVFVRIQLREFFAIDNDPVGFYDETVTAPIPAVRNNPNTWPIFRTSDTNIEQRRFGTSAYDIGHEGIEWTIGQAYNEPFVYMPTFNRAVQIADTLSPALPTTYIDAVSPFFHYHAALSTDAAGAAVDWFTNSAGTDGAYITDATFMTNNHIRDYIIHGIPTAPGITDDTGALLSAEERRNLDDGTRDFWTVDQPLQSHRITTYGIAPNIELRMSPDYYIHYAQENIAWYVEGFTAAELNTALSTPQNPDFEFRGVMTLHQWDQILNRPTGNFWIHDSQDPNGWFYWMGYLEQGDDPEAGVTNATSLLLEAVDLTDNPLEWEYAVYMNGRAFTRQSIDYLYPAISAGANGAIQIFNTILPDETRPHGGLIQVADNGTLTITGSIATELNINDASFTTPANSMGAIRAFTFPASVDPDLVNIEPAPGAAGDFTVTWDGQTVTLLIPYLSALPTAVSGQGCTPANIWVDTGSTDNTEWCVIAEDGHYAMLVTRFLHMRAQALHSSNDFVPWPATTEIGGGPEIRERANTGLNAWFLNNLNVSATLRGGTVHANIPTLRTTPENHSSLEAELASDSVISNNPNGLSTPIANSSSGLPFFLSHADVFQRMGPPSAETTGALIVDDVVTGGWALRDASRNNAENANFAVISSAVAANFWRTSGTSTWFRNAQRPGIWVRR